MSLRYERGLSRLREVDAQQIGKIVAGLKNIAPDFATYLVEFAFGDIYAPGPGPEEPPDRHPVRAGRRGPAAENPTSTAR